MLKRYRQTLMAGVAAIALFAVAPATAADDRWTGAYFGAGASIVTLDGLLQGYGSDEIDDKTISLSDEEDYFSASGAVVEAGYDHQVHDGFVVGIAAQATLFPDGLGNDVTLIEPLDEKVGTEVPRLDYFGEIDATASLVGRVGHEVGDASLVYALGGGTLMHYTVGGTYTGDEGNAESFSWSDDGYAFGWTVGMGLESFLTENTTFKLEYRLSEALDVSAGYDDEPQEGDTRFFADTLQSLTGKIVYRFPQK